MYIFTPYGTPVITLTPPHLRTHIHTIVKLCRSGASQTACLRQREKRVIFSHWRNHSSLSSQFQLFIEKGYKHRRSFRYLRILSTKKRKFLFSFFLFLSFFLLLCLFLSYFFFFLLPFLPLLLLLLSFFLSFFLFFFLSFFSEVMDKEAVHVTGYTENMRNEQSPQNSMSILHTDIPLLSRCSFQEKDNQHTVLMNRMGL